LVREDSIKLSAILWPNVKHDRLGWHPIGESIAKLA